MDGPSDWEGILPAMEDSENTSVLVPESCCGDFNDTKCDDYFMDGCLNRMHFIIGQSAMMIATGATTVAFVQVCKSKYKNDGLGIRFTIMNFINRFWESCAHLCWLRLSEELNLLEQLKDGNYIRVLEL